MKTRWILFIFLLMFAIVSCSSAPLTEISPSGGSPDTQSPILPTPGVPTQMYQSIPDPLTKDLQDLIVKAREHLAERLSIAIEQVNLVSVYDVTWSDTSLGCPQDGMMYAQVLTPGYLIQLEQGTIQYEYHSGKSMQQVVTCENPSQPLPGIPDSY